MPAGVEQQMATPAYCAEWNIAAAQDFSITHEIIGPALENGRDHYIVYELATFGDMMDEVENGGPINNGFQRRRRPAAIRSTTGRRRGVTATGG